KHRATRKTLCGALPPVPPCRCGGGAWRGDVRRPAAQVAEAFSLSVPEVWALLAADAVDPEAGVTLGRTTPPTNRRQARSDALSGNGGQCDGGALVKLPSPAPFASSVTASPDPR